MRTLLCFIALNVLSEHVWDLPVRPIAEDLHGLVERGFSFSCVPQMRHRPITKAFQSASWLVPGALLLVLMHNVTD